MPTTPTTPPPTPGAEVPLNHQIGAWIATLPHEVVLAAGFIIFCLGLLYACKFYQASVYGKVDYWVGLEPFGWTFKPMTILLTPFFCLTKASDKKLIRTMTAGWIHLFWGPVFFLTSLMMVVAGADFMGLQGSYWMNTVLTFGGRTGKPAIVYTPPFGYKFPILKRARRVVFKFLTQEFKTDKTKALNSFERKGVDVDVHNGGNWDDTGEDDD